MSAYVTERALEHWPMPELGTPFPIGGAPLRQIADCTLVGVYIRGGQVVMKGRLYTPSEWALAQDLVMPFAEARQRRWRMDNLGADR